jgi:hypothetical protein
MRPIARLLSHAQRLLDSKEQRTEQREQWWLDRAEEWLQFALQRFKAVKDQIDKHGGLRSARTV